MPYCPQCGTEHASGDVFCSNCGETLADTTAEMEQSETLV